MSTATATTLWPVFEFRPVLDEWYRGWPIERYADGRWVDDDGEYDLAFAVKGTAFSVGLPYQRNIVWSWVDTHWAAVERRHPNGNAWHYMLREGATGWGGTWRERDKHPNILAGQEAMNHIMRARSSASGSGVEFRKGDLVIQAGMLRERESKRVVVAPDPLVCMYCGLKTEQAERLREEARLLLARADAMLSPELAAIGQVQGAGSELAATHDGQTKRQP